MYSNSNVSLFITGKLNGKTNTVTCNSVCRGKFLHRAWCVCELRNRFGHSENRNGKTLAEGGKQMLQHLLLMLS